MSQTAVVASAQQEPVGFTITEEFAKALRDRRHGVSVLPRVVNVLRHWNCTGCLPAWVPSTPSTTPRIAIG